jgi:thiamine biosynthesis protein ThiS
MTIVVNGTSREIADGGQVTVAGLLAHLGMAGMPCAVEVNESLVPKREHVAKQLAEGDRVEIVTLVGGG